MIQCKPVTNGTLTSKNKYYEYRTKTWSNIYFICNNFNFMDTIMILLMIALFKG